jgi:hypothetical protein
MGIALPAMARLGQRSPTAKREKIELRVTREQKELLRAAAALERTPMSTRIIDLALRDAIRLAGGGQAEDSEKPAPGEAAPRRGKLLI